MWQQQFVLLNMFVKREYFCLRGWIIGLEEVVIEMVPVNRYVENKANAAHKFLNNYIMIILCLPVFIKEIYTSPTSKHFIVAKQATLLTLL